MIQAIWTFVLQTKALRYLMLSSGNSIDVFLAARQHVVWSKTSDKAAPVKKGCLQVVNQLVSLKTKAEIFDLL